MERDARREWFRAVVQRGDPLAVEGARDHVRPSDVPALVQQYDEAGSWSERDAVVQLLQDHPSRATTRVMLDFLRCPVVEPYVLTHAAALGHLGDELDRFSAYANDVGLLRRTVAGVRTMYGLAVDESEIGVEAVAPVEAWPTELTPTAALVEAAERGDADAVTRALAAGADPSTIVAEGNLTGCSVLMLACRAGASAAVDVLLAAGADAGWCRPGHTGDPARGQTALWWAADRGRLPVVEALLAAGAAADVRDHHGATPLVQAMSSGHVEAARRLVAAGAEVSQQISDGRTGLHLAVRNGHTDVVRWALDELGQDVEQRGGSGATPLMTAVDEHHPEVVEVLLGAGADVEARHLGRGIYVGRRGWTPLALAAAGGRVTMVRRLLEAGADPDATIPLIRGEDDDPFPGATARDVARGKRAGRVRDLLDTWPR